MSLSEQSIRFASLKCCVRKKKRNCIWLCYYGDNHPTNGGALSQNDHEANDSKA